MTEPCALCRRMVLTSLLLTVPAEAQHLPSIPSLRAGQTLIYRLDLSGSRSTKVESQLTTPQAPPREDLNAQCLIQVEVAEVGAKGFRLKTYMSDRRSAQPSSNALDAQSSSPDKLVEVFVALDGTASEIKGFADLSMARQYAWNAWLNRFTSPMTFPKSGLRPGQRWRSSEEESSASPISQLLWERKYEYVKQESCGLRETSKSANNTGQSGDTCAVVFVHAQLRQRSSPKNATPRDYKIRGLTTSGTAIGTNETILYISTTTGLLVQSTEDVQQTMDATVALADGSNRVRYTINAKSRSQVDLLSDTPKDVR
jgi:hypothetical protein